MNWVTINIPYIERIMPAAQRTAYNAWIAADSDHYMRAILMVENIVMEFRSGIQANPENYLDDDVRKVPQSCARHCETICLFDLALETGAALTEDELTATSKAEIFLRYMFSGRFYLTGGTEKPEPAPFYGPARERDVRVLEG